MLVKIIAGGCSVAGLGLALLAVTPAPAQVGGEQLTGADAFAGWRSDRPGVRRLITAADLPPPFATRSVGNGPGIRSRPAGAKPDVPEGFVVELFADNLLAPRTLRVSPAGDVFVAESMAGRITVLRPSVMGVGRSVFAEGLNAPYGIAFHPPGPDPKWVYVGETNRIVRFAYREGDLVASSRPEVVVPRLPTGGHWTRDIAFSPDGGTLYVAVGSRSNVARGLPELSPSRLAGLEARKHRGAAWNEEDDRAVVLAFSPDGGDKRTHATGIRNCSGVAVQPATGLLWCATNERDGLGDDLPPDYATSVVEGRFYGWPWYYTGINEDPRHAGARPDLAGEVTVPDVLLAPHSAPLGITFYDGASFPTAYHGDAFVTLRGSWNRSERTGYKVVRLLMENGVATGAYEDFMTGFVISEDRVWGRPVGIAVDADGALLVSEDANGTIWRVRAE